MEVEYSQDGKSLKRVVNAEGHFEIPDSIEEIDLDAFRECPNLTSISIPQSVKTIMERTFGKCVNLERIDVCPENTCYLSDDGILYTKDKSVIIACPAGKKLDNFTVPNSVVRIGYAAFQYCKGLSAIHITDSVHELCNCAFNGCTQLTSVYLSHSLKTIDSCTFVDCCNLKEIDIPESVESLDFYAFSGCN